MDILPTTKQAYDLAITTMSVEIQTLRAKVALAEVLREALQNSLVALEKANNSGLITDTIWIGDAETLFDYMGEALSATAPQSLAERKEKYEDKLMAQCTDPNL